MSEMPVRFSTKKSKRLQEKEAQEIAQKEKKARTEKMKDMAAATKNIDWLGTSEPLSLSNWNRSEEEEKDQNKKLCLPNKNPSSFEEVFEEARKVLDDFDAQEIDDDGE